MAPDGDGGNDIGSDNYVESYLYDLHSDPYELQNLIGHASHREVADHLQNRILNAMERASEPRAEIENHPITRPESQRIVYPEEIGQ